MSDRHIKIWISVFVFTLAIVGSGASFFATKGKTFYKGVEPLEKQVSGIKYQVSEVEDVVKTSVLHVEEDINEEPPEAIAEPPQARTAAVVSPCPSGQTPIIKNGQVAGCSSPEEKKSVLQQVPVKISAPLPPAPKVKILTEPNITVNPLQPSTLYPLPSSCESQGLFTYTGPDRPGLLYGMCIDCGTNIFILNGGKC